MKAYPNRKEDLKKQRLDGIVDVMFAATADVANPTEEEPSEDEEQPIGAQTERRIVTDREAIAKKGISC